MSADITRDENESIKRFNQIFVTNLKLSFQTFFALFTIYCVYDNKIDIHKGVLKIPTHNVSSAYNFKSKRFRANPINLATCFKLPGSHDVWGERAAVEHSMSTPHDREGETLRDCIRLASEKHFKRNIYEKI